MRDADTYIAEPGLMPHPEGGYCAETWCADPAAGERPPGTAIIVSAGDWQAAEALGAWTLVGCTVSPGFRFEGFELAESDREPGR